MPLEQDIIEYNGITFIRYPGSKSLSASRYYYPYANGRRMRGVGALHRVIWESVNGPIPEGHEIHHKDEDFLNNDISNLECLTAKAHAQIHHLGVVTPAKLANLDRIRPLTKQWHASPEGRKWHADHAKEVYKSRKPINRVCVQCGVAYQSFARRKNDKFCGTVCAQRWYYRAKSFWIDRVCELCHKAFKQPPGRIRRGCSRSCSARLKWAERRGVQSDGQRGT